MTKKTVLLGACLTIGWVAPLLAAEVTPQTPTEARIRAIFKDISFAGSLSGTLQETLNSEPKERLDAVGRAILGVAYPLRHDTRLFAAFEVAGGDGPDIGLKSYSRLNKLAGSTREAVKVREAWAEYSLGKLAISGGKLQLGRYLDENLYANNEETQFISPAFVNAATSGMPAFGPGIVARYSGDLTLTAVHATTDNKANDLLSHAYTAVEASYATAAVGNPGNIRIMGFLDHALADGFDKLADKETFGLSLSADQEVSRDIGIFARLAVRDSATTAAPFSWSLGAQAKALFPGREGDIAGVALGYTKVRSADSGEKIFESYYSFDCGNSLTITPNLQLLLEPRGDRETSDVVAFGLRASVTF